MVLYPIHKYFVFNHEIRPNKLFVPSENEGGIYEVLRVQQGVPLFFEDHLERFYHSAEIAGKSIRFSTLQIETLLKELIQKNGISEGNILLFCKMNLKAYFIPHNYPSKKMYKTGVDCGLLKAERDNPNAKVFQTSVRRQADKMLAENGFYEVLLVNQSGYITEGSRSNIFFINGDLLVTPSVKQVLPGITRQKAIKLALDAGLTVLEDPILLEHLTSFEASFITGTSPKILPVKKIEKVSFESQNESVRALMQKYDKLTEDYIKSKWA